VIVCIQASFSLMDVCKLIGANVRALRHERGWSQEEFGDRVGLHRTYVSQIERGVRNPTASVIERLAIALDVRPSTLFANWQPPGRVGKQN
jgi:transcriptional regulator with XRE-family HTH domain